MSRAKLVSESYDTDISVSSRVSSEIATSESEDDENVDNGKSNDSYINELEERKKYVQEFINKSFRHFKKGLDFGYVHDQNMSYYQEAYSYSDDRPMLGPVDDNSLDVVSDDGPDYDPDYDEEVNRLLDEVDKEILHDSSSLDADEKNGVDHFDPKREQYEDYYDEFPEDMHHVGPIPPWYQKMLQKKIKETKSRLENLSSLVCYACASTGAHIKRMEQDHSTTFCKMDYPRHPPLDKPWTNFWKFNCMIKCKEIDKPNHAHTADCESVLLVHNNTGVSTATKNICPNEYPKFVMDAVELFQDFAIETTKNVPFLDSEEAKDTVYEKPVWTEMKLRSNYKNELQIVLRGKGVTSLISKLKRYYDTGPGSTSNVVSVYCINQKWSQKKSNFLPSFITGIFKIRDKLGPISINYEPKTSPTFNSVESIQLGKIIEDYAGLTKETTLLDIGCNFGVLSLMMSHRCDRVIGLNTMHYVNSELNQAEELKRNNGVHNVSFMGCEPKDVLTKCSSIVKRSICVAVLNLASPYGKSIYVMQALRNLPTIWRVIIYGSFTKEYHQYIGMLTNKDDRMGDHYLPMQGCLLDKSPSVENAFDVIILFERKSLITPSIELFAPGPTVNVKEDSDSYSYGSLEDSQNDKPIIKLERGFGKPDYRAKKFVNSKPFVKYKGQIKKFGKFDSPMLPMDKEQTPENSQKKSKERSPSPTRSERKFDCSVLKQKPPPIPPITQNGKDKAVYPSIRKELQIKELKRIFDSPYLPLPKEEKPATNGKRSPSPPSKEKKFDCSVLRQEKKFDCSMLKQEKKFDCSMLKQEKKFDCSMLKQEKKFDCSMLKQAEKFDCSMLRQKKKFDCSTLRNQEKLPQRPALPYPSLSVKKEFQLNCPTPPRESFPSPPLPPPPSRTPTGNGFLDVSQIKKEKDLDHPSLSKVKVEPIESCDDDKEEGELSPEHDDGSPTVPVKPKALDPSYFIGFSAVNCESIAQPVTVKSEPSEAVRIKEEPEDTLSANPQDIQNMETPIHHPRALDNGYSSALAKSANFTSVDGHEFSVKPNQSFLLSNAIKKELKEKAYAEADEEIEIIGEKKIVGPAQRRVAEPKIRVKSLDEIIKTKNEAEQNDDLRTLIEQRKTLQRKLDRERETRCYKDLPRRSPSPDSPRRYKREPSSSPPPPFRKYNRSPSPHKRRSPVGRRSWSPSPPPSVRKYNRSPSPYSRRSPGGRRYKRSPPSPTRQWVKRERSPSPRAWIKRERSVSPPPRWVKRERSPTSRRWKRSPSPSEKRYRRSPSPVRLKRDPHSPVRFKRESHSPVSSRWGERSRRSPSSSSSHKSSNKWETYKRSKSPVKSRHEKRKRKSRSRSPAGVKRKCESLSPITSSPSPPRKRDSSKERKKKEKKENKVEKKKNKSKPTSKSNSPTRVSKKKSKTVKDDSTWDILVMSTLPSPPKSSHKLEESKSSDKVYESKSSDKFVELKSSNKFDELKSSEKLDEPKCSDEVDESKSSEKLYEPKSLDKVDEPKNSDKVDESKSSEKLDEPKSVDKVDEPKVAFVAESTPLEQTESVIQECESKSKSPPPAPVTEDVVKSGIATD